MSDVKKIPKEFGNELEKVFGRHGARYFKGVVDGINSKIDELTSATTGNIAVFDANGRIADGGSAPLEGDLSSSRIVYSDASLTLKSVLDLTAWIAVNLGLTVADDGDGSVTLSVKQQTHIADASESHSITGADSVSQASVEAALDAIGVKINSILSALETAEILESS